MLQAEAQDDVGHVRKTGSQAHRRLYKVQAIRHTGRDPSLYFRVHRITLIAVKILSRTAFGAETIRCIAPPTFDRDDVDPTHARLRQVGERTCQNETRSMMLPAKRCRRRYGNGTSSYW